MNSKTIVTAFAFASVVAFAAACQSGGSSQPAGVAEREQALYRSLSDTFPEGFTFIPVSTNNSGACQVNARRVQKVWIARDDLQTVTWMIVGNCSGYTVRVSNVKLSTGSTLPNTTASTDATSGQTMQINLPNDPGAEGEYTYDIELQRTSPGAPGNSRGPTGGAVPQSTGAAPSGSNGGTGGTSGSGQTGGTGGTQGKIRYCRVWPCGA